MIGIGVFRHGENVEPVDPFRNGECLEVRTGDSRVIAWRNPRRIDTSLESLEIQWRGDNHQLVLAISGQIFHNANHHLIPEGTNGNPQGESNLSRTIAQEFLEQGEHFIDGLNGEFVLFLYHCNSGALFCRTDRNGAGRFYYQMDQRCYTASTHLGAVLARITSPAINPSAIDDYFYFGFIPAPATAYCDVYKTHADHQQQLKLDQWQLTHSHGNHLSWQVPGEGMGSSVTVEQGEQLFLDNLVTAIDRRIGDSQSSALLLSSGLDSTLLAGILKTRHSDVRSFTIGYSDRESNENAKTAEIANYLGLKHTDIWLSVEQVMDHLSAWVDAHAEPWSHPNGISTFLAAKRIAETGITCPIFDGSGGDLLFRDYGRLRPYFHIARILHLLPEAARKGMWRVSALLGDSVLARLVGEIAIASSVGHFGLLHPHSRWRGHEFSDLTGRHYDFASSSPGRAFFNGGTGFEQRFLAYMHYTGFDNSIGRVIQEFDLSDMSVKFPYHDSTLMQNMLALPKSLRIGDKKNRRLQRSVCYRFVPESLFWHGKKAIDTPILQILQSERCQRLLDDCLNAHRQHDTLPYNHPAVVKSLTQFREGRIDQALKLWNILVFEMWRARL